MCSVHVTCSSAHSPDARSPPPPPPPPSGGSSGDLSLEEELEKLRLNPDLHAIDADDLEDQGTIGDGNFGTVHKMMNKKKNMVIAVKVLCHVTTM